MALFRMRADRLDKRVRRAKKVGTPHGSVSLREEDGFVFAEAHRGNVREVLRRLGFKLFDRLEEAAQDEIHPLISPEVLGKRVKDIVKMIEAGEFDNVLEALADAEMQGKGRRMILRAIRARAQ